MFQKELTLIKQVCQKNGKHYWYFQDVGFKFEEHVCNNCHNFLTMVYSLKNIAIVSAKGATIGLFCGVLVEMKV